MRISVEVHPGRILMAEYFIKYCRMTNTSAIFWVALKQHSFMLSSADDYETITGTSAALH